MAAEQDLNDLVHFAHVVDHRGFAPAARALGLPKSTLSRRIAQLERRLGVRLLQRSTRSFSVTDVGARYYEHCKAIIAEARAAQESIAQATGEPQGVIRLSCPPALLQAGVSAMLVDFLAANPRVEIRLEASNRRVDLVAEGIDIAIRARTPPLEDSSLALRELAQRDWYLLASPILCQRYPMPQLPSELAGLPSLGYGLNDREQHWQLVGPAGVTATIAHRPRLLTDDLQSLRAAAIAGLGVVQLPAMIVSEDLRSGRLQRLLPQWCSKGAVIHAVFPSRRGLLPAVRALVDFLVSRFREMPAD